MSYPLTAVPQLHSLAGSAHVLYLDFVGAPASNENFGGVTPPATPAYDIDNHPTTFNDVELANIREMWTRVAEKYSPFQVDVTTVDPGTIGASETMKVVVGGDGKWYPKPAGGVDPQIGGGNQNSNSGHTAYVFPAQLSGVIDIGEASAHEAGHGFGLQHQGHLKPDGTVDEYYDGGSDGSASAPIMGVSYDAVRGVWWKGLQTTLSKGVPVATGATQDDLSILSHNLGYRADDHGSSANIASALGAGPGYAASGIVERNDDSDWFSFSTTGSLITLSIDLVPGTMLDPELAITDVSGKITYADQLDPNGQRSLTLHAALPSGSYRFVVKANGYGNLGQYTISGFESDAFEANDSAATATNLSTILPNLPEPILQNLSIANETATDVDWFKFVAPNNGLTSIGLTYAVATGSLNVALFKTPGSSLINSDTGFNYTLIAGQIYYLEVIGAKQVQNRYALTLHIPQAQRVSGSFGLATRIGSFTDDTTLSTTVDAAGNTYAVGTFSGMVDFDPTFANNAVGSKGGSDGYVAKYSSAGQLIWVRGMGGDGDDSATSVKVDSSGNVFLTGYFSNAGKFGSISLTSSDGSIDAFVAKLNSAGTFQWASALGGAGDDRGNGIAIDSTGNVWTTGYFLDYADFDPSSGTFALTSSDASQDAYVSKLSSAGKFLWAGQLGGAGSDAGNGIAIDATGNVWTTGYFFDYADFDPGSGTFALKSSDASQDAYVSKLSSAGKFLWAGQLGGAGTDAGNAIAIDTTGNVYSTGFFFDYADFDPGSNTYALKSSAASQDAYVSKLSNAGKCIWAGQLGGAGDDAGNGIAIDATGNVWTTGYFIDYADFAPGSGTFALKSSAGSQDAYVSKLSSAGKFLAAIGYGGPSSDFGTGIAFNANRGSFVGTFRGYSDFDPGAGTGSLISDGLRDGFDILFTA